jgi:hypothetical protein
MHNFFQKRVQADDDVAVSLPINVGGYKYVKEVLISFKADKEVELSYLTLSACYNVEIITTTTGGCPINRTTLGIVYYTAICGFTKLISSR